MLQIHKSGLHYEHTSIYLVPSTQSLCFLFLISDEHLDSRWAESKQGGGQILTMQFWDPNIFVWISGEYLDPWWWAESKEGGGKISTKSGHDGALRQNIFTQGSQNWKYLHMEPKLVVLRWNTYRQKGLRCSKEILPSPVSFTFSLLFLFLFVVEDFGMVAKLVLTAAPINCKLLSKVFSDQVMQLRAAPHKDVHWFGQVCAKKIVQKGAFMKCTIELHGWGYVDGSAAYIYNSFRS